MPTGTSQRAAADTAPAGGPPPAREQHQYHELTVTIPLDRITDVVVRPVTQVGRMLSARGGLPLYAGLGVLAAVDVIDWPVAFAAGLGYALLRWRRPFGPSHRPGAVRAPQAAAVPAEAGSQAPGAEAPGPAEAASAGGPSSSGASGASRSRGGGTGASGPGASRTRAASSGGRELPSGSGS